ncbi:hypothetical protein AALP_AA6G143500 [Arabis alpina]|uniref:Uncharacterized protein n=1 Tax=Arabis alpina TaxID=50452 RepID=A0A087GP66_ARAAL|nr:hypothetical protein AALP_AA6G143500 [Arabis alpina]
MGCLLGCFGGRKNRRRQRRRESFQPRLNRISDGSIKNVEEVSKVSEESAKDLRVPIAEKVPKISEGSAKDDLRVLTVEEVVIPITDICNKAEEKHSPSPSPTRKRVTFDSKVKTYEHVEVEESIELFEEKREESLKSRQAGCSSEGSDITSNSSGSYPSNHRYQNCRESDDEEEDVTDCEESDLEDINDDEDDGGLLHEDYYNDDESYNDKLQSWDSKVYTEEIADNVMGIERVEEKTRGSSNASARDRSGYVNAVLNPIENLTQWKAVKSNGRTTQTQSRKENANLISDQEHKQHASFSLEPQVDELPSFNFKPKSRDETKKQRTQEVAVDASLSTWLSTSQTTSSERSSCFSISVETAVSEKKILKPVQSHDERPILCALTSDEIKQFSAKNSPRKSPSRSPESPIIGTVGGYWNSYSMATSKYREV